MSAHLQHKLAYRTPGALFLTRFPAASIIFWVKFGGARGGEGRGRGGGMGLEGFSINQVRRPSPTSLFPKRLGKPASR